MSTPQTYSPTSVSTNVYCVSFVQTLLYPGVPIPAFSAKYSSSANSLDQAHLKVTLQPMMSSPVNSGGERGVGTSSVGRPAGVAVAIGVPVGVGVSVGVRVGVLVGVVGITLGVGVGVTGGVGVGAPAILMSSTYVHVL